MPTLDGFVLTRSETVGNRADLALLCDQYGLKTAAEIGTDRGVFALEFLNRWHGEMLYCVDPYASYEQMPWNRDGDLIMAAMLLAPHARRVRIMRTTSLEASRALGPLDFVYIDAAHDFDGCLADIEAWWPNVKAGGILAGDDYDREHVGVMNAVTAFATRHRIGQVWLSTDFNRPPSWFIHK